MIRKIQLLCLLVFILSSCGARNTKTGKEIKVNREVIWLYDWIKAWELVSNDVFDLEDTPPPEMLFFDDTHIYTNSRTSATHGERIAGPGLYGREIIWLKQKHNDTITIPDGTRVSIGIMTFAAPSEKDGVESFFVMAAPSFWMDAGIDNKEIGLKKMLTGVFLHEFAHTRQMNGLGARITSFEKNNRFDFPVSDDLVQDHFINDSSYVQLFREEIAVIYQLSGKPKNEIDPTEVRDILKGIKARQEKYLEPENEVLAEMDRIFLTMEGIGQYAMVAWLIHPEGGAYSEEIAIQAARRGRKWWSQEEGLGLVLLYRKIAQQPDWSLFFSKDPIDIIRSIELETSAENKD